MIQTFITLTQMNTHLFIQKIYAAKKVRIILLVLLFAFTYAKAQDKIVTTQKESFDRWRIGIEGGGAYLLSFSNIEKSMQGMGIPQSNIDDYRKSYRNGMYFGADVHYLITPFFGMGIKYSLFMTSAKLDYTLYLSPTSGYNSLYFNEKDKYYVNYIGPSIVFQQWLDKNRKFRMNEELSIGYVRYREKDQINSPLIYLDTPQSVVSILAEGNALGGNAQLSFEYYPLLWLSVGANAGASFATFKSLKFSTGNISFTQDLDAAHRMNMSYLDYSISVRFHF